MLVYPEMIQRGKLPYRDFETFYGPANPALFAAAFSTLGTTIFVERAVGLVYRLLILLAIFAIMRYWGIRSRWVACSSRAACFSARIFPPTRGGGRWSARSGRFG